MTKEELIKELEELNYIINKAKENDNAGLTE